jgi:hypothetical protein
MTKGLTPAFVLARVSGADGVRVAASVRPEQPAARAGRVKSWLPISELDRARSSVAALLAEREPGDVEGALLNRRFVESATDRGPSAEVRIAQLLVVVGESPREMLSELASIGARLIIQRALEDEFDAWWGRRSRMVKTPERELEIEIEGVSEAAERVVSALLPRTRKRIPTEPLRALPTPIPE